MNFTPSDIGKIEKPTKSKLKQETLNTYNGDQWGDKNPAWKGGVTKDMKTYKKEWDKRNKPKLTKLKKEKKAQQKKEMSEMWSRYHNV